MRWEDEAGAWYHQCVGEKGHHFHQALILSRSLDLLGVKKRESLLDLGCGQGVLLNHVHPEIEYVGIDASKFLIQEAKKRGRGAFFVADVTQNLPLEKRDFDAACFILSLQNIEHPDLAIARAGSHLKQKGKLLLVLNHPCFRIPRQSHWGIDETAQLQYRRMNLYMSSQKIPIQTQPSQKQRSPVTFSFHFPLSCYTKWLQQAHFVILTMEEWCSDKTSVGARAKMENRARREFPLFLAILAEK